MKFAQQNVLCMSDQPKHRSTVRRHYLRWRKAQGIPERCDTPTCLFHTNPLFWNNHQLGLILDHISGNSRDNTPQNLRFLCPNCDSQNQETRGGANAGRIEVMHGGSYHVRNRNGTQDAFANGALPSASVLATTDRANSAIEENIRNPIETPIP